MERLDGIAKTRYVPAIYSAAIYFGLGDMDQTYRRTEKAYADRSHYVVYLNVDPSLDRFRLDARFSEISRRLAFPAH